MPAIKPSLCRALWIAAVVVCAAVLAWPADNRPAFAQVESGPVQPDAAQPDAKDDADKDPDELDPDAIDAMHADMYVRDRYPSAKQCAVCHPTHFRQWSASQHAYAQLSPVFNSMHAKILKLTNGTFGDFCIRCHTPVGMEMGEPVVASNIDRHAVSREGVTCIVCHRPTQPYGKVSGRIAIRQGPITDPIAGPTGDSAAIDRLVKDGEVTDNPDERGRKIHGKANRFFQLTQPGFCGTCHDVTFINGFRLEEAFSHYKSSPAAKAGVSCQDCHMGKEPGIFTGDEKTNYEWGPAARVFGEWTKPRKLTNHMIVGPDYSVVHPALFPVTRNAIKEEADKDDPKATGFATIRQWLQFDHEAGWGTDAFEKDVADNSKFPQRWRSPEQRRKARAIVDANLELLEEARQDRLKLLRRGYVLRDVEVEPLKGHTLRFRAEVANGTTGHAVPTGFDADRLVWLYVKVTDPRERVVFESGDLDPNGDVRDLHSAYVHNGELPLDKQLFNLQGRFLIRNLRGGEREKVLSVNQSTTPLPFARPPTRSNILAGQPNGARKHRMSINPGASRIARYEVDLGKFKGAQPPLTITVELKAAMVPVNLINEIKDVGFDYGMSARDVAEAVVAGHEVLWRTQVTVTGQSGDAE